MCACWHYVPQLLLVFGRPPAGYPKPRYASFSSATYARRLVRGDTIVRKYSSVCMQVHVFVRAGISWSTAEGVDRRQHRFMCFRVAFSQAAVLFAYLSIFV